MIGPEDVVLRIERAAGDDGLVLQLAETDAVFGNVGDESGLAAAAHGLESLGLRHARAGIQKRREIVGDMADVGEDDIVVFVATERDEAELRPRKGDAILAFRVTCDFPRGDRCRRTPSADGRDNTCDTGCCRE